MAVSSADLWPWFALMAAGFLPNEIWRWLGIVFARGLDERSEIVVWVRAVATAILAAVIAKLVMAPTGALAETPVAVRLGAIAIGFTAFLLIRRSVLAGILAGQAALMLGMALVR